MVRTKSTVRTRGQGSDNINNPFNKINDSYNKDRAMKQQKFKENDTEKDKNTVEGTKETAPSTMVTAEHAQEEGKSQLVEKINWRNYFRNR